MYGETREEKAVPWERFLTRVVEEYAFEHGIGVTSLSGGWIIALEKRNWRKCIFGLDFGLNSSVAKLLARDKAATGDVLSLDNIPHVEHRLFLRPDSLGANPNGNWASIKEWFEECSYDVVCKPNLGSSGQHVERAQTVPALERIIQELFMRERAVAISPYLALEAEYRITILDDEVVLAYEKRQSGDELKFNLSSGATACEIEDAELLSRINRLALRAAQSIDIRFANVDIVRVENDLYVLEVNSGVMFEHYASLGARQQEEARAVYRKALGVLIGS